MIRLLIIAATFLGVGLFVILSIRLFVWTLGLEWSDEGRVVTLGLAFSLAFMAAGVGGNSIADEVDS